MRTRFKYYPITQGHIIASWNIIYLVGKYEFIHPSKINDLLINSGKLGGNIPAKQGMRICIDYNFVCVQDGKLCLSEITKNYVISLCDTDDPNYSVLRAILGHIISFHNFQWLIFYDTDPEIFKEYLLDQDPEWVVLLENASLFNFADEIVSEWWKSVLIKYEDYKAGVRKAMGDVGEKLTYKHELSRIEEDGYKSAKSLVKWASQISDVFGYDILSVRGKRFLFSHTELEKIQIEVKSSDTCNIESFRFFISKPEWKTALENLHTYFFYCWAGINIERETAVDGPFVIPATELVPHMPVDVSSMVDWSECRCVINISKYRIE